MPCLVLPRRGSPRLSLLAVAGSLVVVVVVVVGAGCNQAALPAEPVDAAAPPRVDLGVADLVGAQAADLAHAPRVGVGQPCVGDDDCAAGPWGGLPTGACRVDWPGGACVTPCRLDHRDPATGLVADCGGDGFACVDVDGSGVTGWCVPSCRAATGCRAGYGCASDGPIAACLPLAQNPCDPLDDPRRSGRSCGGGLRCFPASPDDSWGVCGVGCDPLSQDCVMPGMGLLGCLASEPNTGGGRCVAVAGRPEGRACNAPTDCAPGLTCNQGACRRYCRAGGQHPVACPPGQGCGAVPGGRYPSSVLGLCSP